MNRTYEVFLADPEKVPEGKEIRFFVRDLATGPRKYEVRFVKAVVSSSRELLPNGDSLQLRSLDGKLHSRNLFVRIVEELGNCVSGRPYEGHTGLFGEKQDS